MKLECCELPVNSYTQDPRPSTSGRVTLLFFRFFRTQQRLYMVQRNSWASSNMQMAWHVINISKPQVHFILLHKTVLGKGKGFKEMAYVIALYLI